MTSLDAWSSIGCAAMHTSCKKKKKKKIEVSILGWLSNDLLWHCNAFFCFVWLQCSLLFLESLVPFLISPYNRIVNLELIKFAAKLLLLLRAANCLRVLFALQLDYIFVVYCINTTQLVMRWVAMSQHP